MKKILTLITLCVSMALGACAQNIAPGIPNGRPAPDFALPNADGKIVKLSDFKGQWVVLDFWGSWCGWCIKGFPQMKENYKELGEKVAFVGVACRDSKENWLAALKKYELPWVNVWVDEENTPKIIKEYSLRGFPTKLIIDPEGNVQNTTIGEDPAFYTTLRELIK